MLGLLLRVLYALWLGNDLLLGDAFYYVDTAKAILAGESYLPEWPPALPYYLSLFGAILGQSLWSWISAMLVLYLLFNWIWKEIASLFVKNKWVNVGAILFAIMPAFIHYSVAPLSQLPLAIIILALVGLLYKNGATWKMGALLAVGVLFRSGTFSLIPLFLIYIPIKKSSREFLPFFLGFFIFIGIWQYTSWKMTDRFVWINDFNSYNVYVGNNAWTPDYKTWWLGSHDERGNESFAEYYQQLDSMRALPIERQSLAFGLEATGYIESRPFVFVNRMANRFRTFFAFDTYSGARLYSRNRTIGIMTLLVDGVMYFLLAVGFILAIGRSHVMKQNQMNFILMSLLFLFMLPYLLAFSHPSYHLPFLPIFAIFGLSLWEENGAKSILQNLSYLHFLAIGFFIFIQLEWLWHMKGSL
ncbi:MAG: hypothetical protein AAFY45_11330 [Bacteroidota bacterium]